MSLGVRETIPYTIKNGPSAGEKVLLTSLRVQDWVSIEKEALRLFKEEFIKTSTDNLHLLKVSSERQEELGLKAIAEARQIQAEDLPSRRTRVQAYKSNGKGKRVPVFDDNNRPVLREVEVDYATHWLSDTAEGKLFATWLSITQVKGQENMTMEDAGVLLLDEIDKEEVAQLIGEISNPKVLTDEETEQLNFTEQKDQTKKDQIEKEERKRNRAERRRKREQRRKAD